jgi:hypothetical protein
MMRVSDSDDGTVIRVLVREKRMGVRFSLTRTVRSSSVSRSGRPGEGRSRIISLVGGNAATREVAMRSTRAVRRWWRWSWERQRLDRRDPRVLLELQAIVDHHESRQRAAQAGDVRSW